MKIRLHVDKLIVDGLSTSSIGQPALRETVTAELDRLIREQGLGAHMKAAGEHRRMRGSDISVHDRLSAQAIGREIAKSVYSGIGPDQPIRGGQHK